MTDTHCSNQNFAIQTLIHTLLSHGVTHFCIAPGSRSTPLTYALAKEPKATKLVHFDERGLGFYALGYAKATQKPVAIVITSGTAVGNLFPAIMEAALDQVPLVVLTCDRPVELRDVGANQTADQVKIFGSYVRHQVDIPFYEAFAVKFIETTLSHSVFRAQSTPKGPVQINCMFREPFFGSEEKEEKPAAILSTKYETGKASLSESSVQEFAHIFQNAKKGVILLGSLPHTQDLSPIFSLAEKLSWPVVSDIGSGSRSHGFSKNHIRYSEYILKQDVLRADLILQFGSRLVGRPIPAWIRSCADLTYCMVADHPIKQDPDHNVNYRIQLDPSRFAQQLLLALSTYEAKPHNWLSTWQGFSTNIEKKLSSFLQMEEISEPAIVAALAKILSSKQSLFIANSMPIRDANSLLYPNHPIGPIFANRGLSGIDGNIATAVGIAEGSKTPVVAMIGDLACLHDFNSISLLQKASYPVILLVINNYGGGIFSFLPIQEKKDVFEEYFATAHSFDLSVTSSIFTIPALRLPQQDWESSLKHIIEQNKSCVIEICTDREENLLLHKKITDSIKLLCDSRQESLTSTFS